MALPTNGRVIVDTTVGEIEIELWSKVSICHVMTATTIWGSFDSGNAKSMSEFPCARHGGFVSSSQLYWDTLAHRMAQDTMTESFFIGMHATTFV